MEIKQGDIFWVELDESHGSEPGYRHPQVVVQNNVFNKSKINTVVMCTLTSNLSLAAAPGNIMLRKGEANLPKASVANISQLFTVNKSDLKLKIGTLSKERIHDILAGIHLIFGPKDIV